jgi:hypothetical protein
VRLEPLTCARATGFFLLLTGLFATAATVQAADLDEYARLLEEADAAHVAVDDAPPERLPQALRAAVEADQAVIEWLDTLIASEEFETWPEDSRAAIFQGRFRVEYNLAGVLIPLDRCVEARDSVRALLDSAVVNDEELRPLLVERYDESNACINRPRTADLMVFSLPQDAILMLDGEYLGTAEVSHAIGLGEHELTVTADGYFPQEFTVVAENEGDNVQLGPVTLVERPPDTSAAPTWYEWTLWGAGGVGIAFGIERYLAARRQEDELENPPAGGTIDEEEAQDIIDRRDRQAIIFGSLGLACAIAGTWSYLARRSGDDDEAEGEEIDDGGGGEQPLGESVSLGFGLGGVTLGFRF